MALRKEDCFTLLETFEEFIKALDEGYGTDVIYLDFREAFDAVSHKKLLKKVRACGIQAFKVTYLSGSRTFLTNRRTRVRVNGSFSDWFDAISGVHRDQS